MAVRIRGLRELNTAFSRLEKSVAKEIRDELKEAAEPIARSAQGKVARYAGASIGTIGPRATTKSVFVTQRAKKVTGKRPDFGALQQHLFEEALDEHAEELVPRLEGVLDRLTRGSGF